jgi:hypothetical protein
MKSSLSKILAASLIAGTVCGAAFAADAQPAAKSTAKVSAINLIDSTTQEDWTTILTNDIKTANGSELFVDVSMECGLYTDTLVKSKNGNKDTSTTAAVVLAKVLVDGQEAHPGEIVLCGRVQQLTATFQGLLTDEEGNSCLLTEAVTDENGTITGYSTTIDEECVRPEELGLLLNTMNANSFNFIASDLESGVHTIEVQAMINSFAEAGEGTAEAFATVGKGSVIVEEVKMVKDEDLINE